MFEVSVLFLILGIASATGEVPSWDISVALKEHIALLKNGTVLMHPIEQFTDIKALAYHYNKNTFIVADRNSDNDTIYLVDGGSMAVIPFVENLEDDIQGIAVDPVTDTIYWTDIMNKSINYKSFKDASNLDGYNTLFDFQQQQPQDIVIDSCKRMIYWTNLNIKTPTIEKSTIMGTDRQVLVKTDLSMPSALAIDHLEQRLYWADKREGIYFRIESIDFDGNDRQVLYEGTHRKPFGLTIDKDYVYWTDINNNGIWRKDKFSTEEPVLYYKFDVAPRGISARFTGFPEEPNCDKLGLLIKRKNQAKENEKVDFKDYVANENKTCEECVHGKREDNNCTCICESGYTGSKCDISVCFNYCQHGKCWVNEGKPKCECMPGFTGSRCEKNSCDNYCLNGGVCDFTTDVRCTCPNGFKGARCETLVPVSNYEICKAVCSNTNESIVVHNDKSFLCSCSDLSYMMLEVNNSTELMKPSVYDDFSDMFWKHPFVLALVAGNLLMLALSMILVIYICKIKRMRPRIKKRVVVNKNITPLTYRPQAVEQCEITIEDCCNMNICETPCFEPRIQMKKDEKKTLLENMEHNEEFY